MSESILKSMKKLLSISEDDASFDTDITIHINTVFADLQQLGVGSEHGFAIEDDSTTWDAFLADDLNLNQVKTYMYFRVRLIFDPPPTQAAINSFQAQVDKLEFRLNVQKESTDWVNPFNILDPVMVPVPSEEVL